MTDYERIRTTFHASATVCRYGNQPRLEYDPGCLYVECAKSDECRCRLADGDGGSTTAFLIEWQRRFTK
jgi:hypothetical protein